MNQIRIGTRGSNLALIQAKKVAETLAFLAPEITTTIHAISTRGDRETAVPLHKVQTTGVFVKELEQALIDGSIDIADPIFTLVYAFGRGTAPVCPDSCDSNDDGEIDLADAVSMLSYLFDPPATREVPATCDRDATPDLLGGCRYSHCR